MDPELSKVTHCLTKTTSSTTAFGITADYCTDKVDKWIHRMVFDRGVWLGLGWGWPLEVDKDTGQHPPQ